MNEALKQRLAGVLVLIAAAFIVSFLLPAPGRLQGDGDDRRVVIDLTAAPGVPQAITPAPVTPVPPAIAAPEKSVAALEPLPDTDDAAPKIDEPPATVPAAAEPVKPAKTPAVATEPASPAPKSETPAKTPTPAVPPKPAQATRPEHAAAEKPPAGAPHAPALKLESTLQHEPISASPKPAPPPSAAKHWYVQAGAFIDVANARQAMAKLGAGGLKAIIAPADTPSGTRYRVRVGPYATREQAREAQQRMTQLGFSGGALAED